MNISLGSRTSNLAMWQTHHVIALLQSADSTVTCQVVPFVTKGDRTLDKPLPQIGGKGLFTLELEAALRSGDIDIAVHSLKDLPVEEPDGLTLGAIIGRADVRDVIVSKANQTLAELPKGALVGTSSLRRKGQLLAIRPDLNIESIRGNVETRIRKVKEGRYDATVLAMAGVARLGLLDAAAEILPYDTMLPAPGQGALGIQCRADDRKTLALLQKIEPDEVRDCVTLERAFLVGLGGGCSTPVGAWARYVDGRMTMDYVVTDDRDGRLWRNAYTGRSQERPADLGARLAAEALADGADQFLHA